MDFMRIGVDAGGTFTDFVVLRDDGTLESFKLRSNPAAPASVILQGLRQYAQRKVVEVIHGSTVATNALLERKGAKTAFVTTAGFEDLLEIGRQNRAELYNLTPAPRRLLADRALCFGVKERAYFDGTIARKPTPAELNRLAATLRRADVASVAICFLHAYRNSANERATERALKGFSISRSSEICPEFREYERGSTTFINAYVRPLMEDYLAELGRARGFRISIMQSSGGFLSTKDASRHAVRTVLSGPAGGVVGALETARRSGVRRILAFDMGGTSTDVCLCDGAPSQTTEATVDGFPVRVPMLDIQTVGAGGGSIARVDAGGLLRVGPESAGAVPGPACYGLGSDATVTDAQVVLGRIDARQLLGGQMQIDLVCAEKSLDPLAKRLKLSRDQTAAGIVRVANANMERAIRSVSVERGHDPRDFALVAFGGSGGLHACEIARELGMRSVIVPAFAGALSALGMLLADEVRDFSASTLGDADPAQRLDALERRARRALPDGEIERSADVRYRGQSYELNVAWTNNLARAFHRRHKNIYGYATPAREIEIVTLRVRARRKTPRLRWKTTSGGSGPASTVRRIWLNGAWRNVRVLSRDEVTRKPKAGPALILDYGSTTLVPPAWSYHLDHGNLLLQCQTRV